MGKVRGRLWDGPVGVGMWTSAQGVSPDPLLAALLLLIVLFFLGGMFRHSALLMLMKWR